MGSVPYRPRSSNAPQQRRQVTNTKNDEVLDGGNLSLFLTDKSQYYQTLALNIKLLGGDTLDKQKEKLQKCQNQVISCIESRINNRNGDGVIQENNLGVGRGKLGLARGSGVLQVAPAGVFGGRSPLQKFFGFLRSIDWLKIYTNFVVFFLF